MDIDYKLRKLAKSNYWQNIFKASKQCYGVRLFENKSNFSALQERFFYWLTVYDMLFTELATYEDDLLTQSVLDDEFRTDAYLIHRKKKNDYLWQKHRAEERDAQLKVNRKKTFKHPGKESTIEVDLRRE